MLLRLGLVRDRFTCWWPRRIRRRCARKVMHTQETNEDQRSSIAKLSLPTRLLVGGGHVCLQTMKA